MSQHSSADTVREALERVFSELAAWLARPACELSSRPDYPGAWSCLEHLEHVSLVNHFLLLTIGKGCAKALGRSGRLPPPDGESDLTPLASLADPDAFEWTPPAHMVPAGGCDPAKLRGRLEHQRDRCLELLAGMPAGEGRLCTIRMSVHDLGRLDMYQWLYFLAQHGRYHLVLLERIPLPP
jgi:hypothetical protein